MDMNTDGTPKLMLASIGRMRFHQRTGQRLLVGIASLGEWPGLRRRCT